MNDLTPRENFWRMIHRDNPQWLPLDLPVTAPAIDLIEAHTGTRDVVQAFSLDFVFLWVGSPENPAAWRKAYANIGFDVPDNAHVEGPGITHAIPPAESVGAAYHLREMLHPLSAIKNVEQLQNLPWPTTDWSADSLLDQRVRIDQTHRSGLVASASMECTIFEFAWYLRGMDNLFLDLIEGNGIADWLLDWFMNRSIKFAQNYAHLGVDVIALGDDVGTQRGMMMSVDFWREHLKGRLKKVIDAIRNERGHEVAVKYHSDGNITDIVPDLIEIGVDILNPVQPECMSAKELVNTHPELGLWGMLGTQTTMPFGTPDDVRQVVRECAAYARQGAAIIVAPTHVIEPDVPWENIAALVGEIRKTKLDLH